MSLTHQPLVLSETAILICHAYRRAAMMTGRNLARIDFQHLKNYYRLYSRPTFAIRTRKSEYHFSRPSRCAC